jgi:Gpi18-like mannosyltransferase
MLTKIAVLGKIKKFDLFFIITIAIILRLATGIYFANFHYTRLVQDDYAPYADAMLAGKLNTHTFVDYDRRLFPTYPIVIAIAKPLFNSSLYAGIAISILSSLFALYLALRVFKDKFLVFLMAISPPIWLEQSVKVANESLFIVLVLSALLLFFRKSYVVTGIILGIAFTTRPIALTLLVSLIILLLQRHQLKTVSKMLAGFMLPVFLLLFFNYTTFGPHELLQQFSHPDRYGQLQLGFIQIAKDIYRTLSWKDYRTFISGTFYVLTNLLALVILIRYRKQSELSYLCFLWLTITLIFILTFSPFKILDDFGRYALAALPAYLYGFSLFYTSLWKMFISKNRLHKKVGR